MAIIPVKCPFCGQDFKTELESKTTVCENCKKEFEVDQGSKYYKSITKIKNQKKIIATGELYAKVDNILKEAEFYLGEQDYAKAQSLYEQALSLTNVDYRVYLGLVYVKTKSFTDLDDKEHFKFLSKAIECASEIDKEYIKKIYSPYHTKRSIPLEEREEYDKQEEQVRYKKVETLLKDSIPTHLQNEKRLKPFLFLTLCCAFCSLTLLVLGLSIDVMALSISSSAFAILTILFLSNYSNVKSKTFIFNAILDLFDDYDKLNLPSKVGIEFLKELYLTAISVINKDSDLTLKRHLINLLNISASGNLESSKEFFASCPSISKFIQKNLDIK